MDQLRDFEKDSFEIQQRIKKGIEKESENEIILKNNEKLKMNELQNSTEIERLKFVLKKKEEEIQKDKNLIDNLNKFNS